MGVADNLVPRVELLGVYMLGVVLWMLFFLALQRYALVLSFLSNRLPDL